MKDERARAYFAGGRGLPAFFALGTAPHRGAVVHAGVLRHPGTPPGAGLFDQMQTLGGALYNGRTHPIPETFMLNDRARLAVEKPDDPRSGRVHRPLYGSYCLPRL